MINIPITIHLPQLWGSQIFKKNEWGNVNLLVGSNGTGKSLFSEQFKTQLNSNGYKTRILNAERLSGLEKQPYNYFSGSNFDRGLNTLNFAELKEKGDEYGLSTSAFVILKERLDIRIKIEALLSDIFKKTIRLVEEGGFLKPKIQNLAGGVEYGLKESECHGLKELITLLTFLYDDSKNCLILDEPELHLHPQFQSFLLNEIRSLSGDPKTDPSKKLFFIITHSPYFLDLRNIEDFKSILVFHYNEPPTYVDILDGQDEYILKRFLPRFNTHHKQFFFSPNPVFVEGYTDQQIITLLFDKLDYKISAAGSCVIDVGGKDELAVFFNLCRKLKIEGRIIADLDALFKGKLREVGQKDSRSSKYIQANGLGTDLSSMIGDLEKRLKEIADDLVQKLPSDPDVIHIINFLKPIISIADNRHHVITGMLIALQKFNGKISKECPTIVGDIDFILPRYSIILKSLEAANIYIIPNGEIEHHYTQTAIDYLCISDSLKNTSFHKERDYILNQTDTALLETNYAELLKILKSSVPQIKVDLTKHLKFQILEWLQRVQRAIEKGDVTDVDALKANAGVDYKLFSQILEVMDLKIEEDKRFICGIKINKLLSATNQEISFNEKTTPRDFNM